MKDPFFQQSAVIFLLSQVGSFFHFLYQYEMSHALSKERYGALNALLSLAMILTVPMATLQMGISKYVSQFKLKNNLSGLRCFYSLWIRDLFLFSCGMILFFYVFKSMFISFFHIESSGVFILLSIFAALGFFHSFGLGVLQGEERFLLAGFCALLAGVFKWASGVGVISIGYSLSTLMSALILSSAVVLAVLFSKTRSYWVNPFGYTSPVVESFHYFFPSFLAYSMLSLILLMDVIWVQHFFGKGSSQAGLYATAAVLGKTVFYVSLSIVMVMFPKVVVSDALKANSKIPLVKTLLMGSFISGSVLALFLMFPEKILMLFGKQEAVGAVLYLRGYAMAMWLMLLLHIFVNYFIALSRFEIVGVLFGMCALQVTLIFLFHARPEHILWVIQGVYLIGNVTCVWFVLKKRTIQKPIPSMITVPISGVGLSDPASET